MTNNPPAPFSRLSLLLLLLAPGVGLASPQAPDTRLPAPSTTWEALPLVASSGVPGSEEPMPLRLSEDSALQEAPPPRPSRGLRILAELGAGFLTGAGGGLGGFGIGSGLCHAGLIGDRTSWFPCLSEAGYGAYAGIPIGFALGVWWGGEAAGGDGRLLGMLTGMGTGAVVAFLASAIARIPFQARPLFAMSGAMLGSLVGYELSQREPAPGPQVPAVASARPRLQPLLAFSPRGAVVGLGGSF